MKIREIIKESLENWSGEWVHYSKVPYIKINPKPFHQDPLAIYLFPAEFNVHASWTNYPYKFHVTIKPDARILDLSKISQKELEKIVDLAGATEKYQNYVTQYPPETMEKRVDMAWDMMTAHFAYEGYGEKKLSIFNKLFRSLGYDAIFDDIKVLLNNEIQLVVLNPRIIKITKMETRGGSGFAEVKMVMDMVVDLASEYGDLEIEQPKRVKERYSTKYHIEAMVKVVNPQHPRNYLHVKIGTDDNIPPQQVHASVLYSSPSLNAGYGGRSYLISQKKFDTFRDEPPLADIKRALEKTFREPLPDYITKDDDE